MRYRLKVYDVESGEQVLMTEEVAREMLKDWILSWLPKEEPKPRGRPPKVKAAEKQP